MASCPVQLVMPMQQHWGLTEMVQHTVRAKAEQQDDAKQPSEACSGWYCSRAEASVARPEGDMARQLALAVTTHSSLLC
jgi:hypothetical protein